MEEKETKNKFWKGVLVGVLVTAFSGLAVVGVATGIWTVGRRASESQSTQTAETIRHSAGYEENRAEAPVYGGADRQILPVR